MSRPPAEPLFNEPVVLPTLHTPELSRLTLDDLGLQQPDELAANQHLGQLVCRHPCLEFSCADFCWVLFFDFFFHVVVFCYRGMFDVRLWENIAAVVPVSFVRDLDCELLCVQWTAGTTAGLTRLVEFLERRLPAFGHQRAKVDRESTSGLSPHIHFGELSVRGACSTSACTHIVRFDLGMHCSHGTLP